MSLAAGTLLGGIGLLTLGASAPAPAPTPAPARAAPGGATMQFAPAQPETIVKLTQRPMVDAFAAPADQTTGGEKENKPAVELTPENVARAMGIKLPAGSVVTLPIGRHVIVQLAPRGAQTGTMVQVEGELLACNGEWVQVRTPRGETFVSRGEVAAIVADAPAKTEDR